MARIAGGPESLALAERVKVERRKRDWSQRKLAAEARMAAYTIWKLEQGHAAGLPTVYRIARAFGLTTAQLVDGIEQSVQDLYTDLEFRPGVS